MLIGNNLHTYTSFKGSLLSMLPKPQPAQAPASNQNTALNTAVPAGYAPVSTPIANQLKKQTAPSLLAGMLANAAKNYQTENAQKIPSELKTPKLEGYKNNLRSMFQNNQAVIYAMVPRTFNAKDNNGNRLIEEELGEEKGTFINMIERLDELKSYGINTLHWLPVNPPGKIAAKGSAGSVYAPKDYLAIDPALDDPNNPKSVYEEAKEAINECHKRGIKVMIDLPSCMSVDLYDARPDLRAEDAQGNPKTPEGWEDIRMFGPWADADKRILNPDLMKYHKDFIDMCLDLGIDGIRADVARAKPVEFWDELISYARSKDPEFGFLAETYVYEDASPMKNMPADRPEELLESGFDTYYGQYHIFPSWKAKDFHQFVKDNLKGFQYKITYGGDERYLSVLNGLKLAKTKQVMIHDGARPFVDLKALEELLTLKENEIGMLYGNVKETIYLKDNKLELLNRASLIAAKTPQIIIKDLYQEAYKKAMLDKYEPTDDISLILKYYNDINVKLVLDDRNVKITVKDDLKYLGGDFIKC